MCLEKALSLVKSDLYRSCSVLSFVAILFFLPSFLYANWLWSIGSVLCRSLHSQCLKSNWSLPLRRASYPGGVPPLCIIKQPPVVGWVYHFMAYILSRHTHWRKVVKVFWATLEGSHSRHKHFATPHGGFTVATVSTVDLQEVTGHICIYTCIFHCIPTPRLIWDLVGKEELLIKKGDISHFLMFSDVFWFFLIPKLCIM